VKRQGGLGEGKKEEKQEVTNGFLIEGASGNTQTRKEGGGKKKGGKRS